MAKLNLPQWTETHAVLLDQEIMAVRSKMLHYQGREERGTADAEDLAALELYTGILHTLVTMRRPVGAIGIHGAPVLREIIADALGGPCKHEWSVDERNTRRCIGCGAPHA